MSKESKLVEVRILPAENGYIVKVYESKKGKLEIITGDYVFFELTDAWNFVNDKLTEVEK